MSDILETLGEYARKGEYFPLLQHEKIELTRILLPTLSELEAFLNMKGDMFTYPELVRYGLHALDHLVLNGCYYYYAAKPCEGDIAITGKEASVGRCCKCGKLISDFRG